MQDLTDAPRHLTSLPPLSSRDWSDTATDYRDAAALEWDRLNIVPALRLDGYAARCTSRALTAWHESQPLPHAA